MEAFLGFSAMLALTVILWAVILGIVGMVVYAILDSIEGVKFIFELKNENKDLRRENNRLKKEIEELK